MSTVTFRSATDSGLGDNKTVTPGTIVDGDTIVLVAWYYNDNTSTTPGTVTCTPPAGFTSRLKTTYNFVCAGAVSDLQINVEVFTKLAASESGDYTVTVSDNDAGASAYTNLGCIVFSGAGKSAPIVATSHNSGGPSSSSSTATGTGITVPLNSSQLLWIFGGYDNDATLPSGMTARLTDVDGVNSIATLAVDAGATGDKTATVAGETLQQNGWIAQLIALTGDGATSLFFGSGTVQ